MKILVCGGRDFADWFTLCNTLDTLHDQKPITLIIEGGARGADSMASYWANHRKIPVRQYKANWNRYGASAGPIRNRQMLEEGKPDLVVAFRGGPGTANMVKQAKSFKVPVEEIP